MAELMIMRHGKSDWETAGQSDRDRELAPRGVKAARRVGAWMAARELLPDRVLVSPAVRTRQTLDLAMEAGEWEAPCEVVDELYLATETVVIDVIERLGGAAGRLLVVGHEPFCSGLVGLLCGASCRFPTAAVAQLRGPDDWTGWRANGAVLECLVPPRLLKAL